jgi:S-methylmethionine-dependent homocysteine/selenocysteine methylase
MPRYRDDLPQVSDRVFLTDGGLETTLIFDDGLDLPDFAAFHLLASPSGRDALTRYLESYAAIARRDGVGLILETPTWRASADWGVRLGYTVEQVEQANRESVELLDDVRRRFATPESPIVVSGCVGPRGDGYQPGELMTVDEARAYHALQIRAFAGTEADLIGAITMNYVAEAVGVAQAARAAGMPVVLSFTVETDGVLPDGTPLRDAIEAVDAATGAYPAYYMINCAHPDHFRDVLEPGAPWTARIRGMRANASRLSHAELDAAEELDSGDAAELAGLYRELRAEHPGITVLGGCCGTNATHVDLISRTCAVAGVAGG